MSFLGTIPYALESAAIVERHTMILTEIKAAVSAVKKFNQLDYLAQLLWKQHGMGAINDTDAQSVAEAIEVQKRLLVLAPARRWKSPVLNRPKRSYDTRESIKRRRRQAASGMMPPTLVSAFTLGEQSVLSVIAVMALRGGGVCGECIAKIAALAGTSRTVVQSALRTARQLGLVRVTERPRKGLPNLTNIVEIIDASWKQWLEKRNASNGGRVKISTYHDISSNNQRLPRPISGGISDTVRSGWGLARTLSKRGT